MEWLNQIPVNLDGGFISLGILLCSLAVITWVVFWIGKFEKEAHNDTVNVFIGPKRGAQLLLSYS